MAVDTVLLDFSIDPTLTTNEKSLSVLSSNIEEVLRDFLTNLKEVNKFSFDGTLTKIFTADAGSLIHFRIFTNGLITLNIEYFDGDKDVPLMRVNTCRQLETAIKKKIKDVKRIQMLSPIKRGRFIRYYITSDGRLLEYDVDSLVFEEMTPHQKVEIVHSKSLGNMLRLDGIQNIAESDLIYTETLMQRGKENYKNKEILTLGEGNGALLYELLKEKPKRVTMLEMDEVVIKACSKYMRSVCGSVLDRYETLNYKIIVGDDCMEELEQYAKEGKKFDYIFGDMCGNLISEYESKEFWTAINKMLELSFNLLKPDGKLMTNLTGSCCLETIELYKNQLQKLNPPVKFTMDTAFVPSFYEEWVFCQVSFDDQKQCILLYT